jgi:hypothetical protein
MNPAKGHSHKIEGTLPQSRVFGDFSYDVGQRGERMTEPAARWRSNLFRSALAFVAMDTITYVCGIVVVSVLGTVDAKIRAGAWLFLVGTALSLVGLTLSLFGHGWKRVGLALSCLLALPFWYGFTLY